MLGGAEVPKFMENEKKPEEKKVAPEELGEPRSTQEKKALAEDKEGGDKPATKPVDPKPEPSLKDDLPFDKEETKPEEPAEGDKPEDPEEGEGADPIDAKKAEEEKKAEFEKDQHISELEEMIKVLTKKLDSLDEALKKSGVLSSEKPAGLPRNTDPLNGYGEKPEGMDDFLSMVNRNRR